MAQHHTAQLNWAHALETPAGAPEHMSADTNGAADPSAGATHCLHIVKEYVAYYVLCDCNRFQIKFQIN